MRIPPDVAGVIAIGVNSGAYIAEIVRGAIQSIDKGQYEAAKVLGFSRSYTFFHIVLPQVIKRILPALGNEVITLVKDTALAQTIGVSELFRVAQTASSRVFIKAPDPTLTSRTMPSAPAAIFFDMMLAAMSGMLSTVAVTSRRA